MKLAIVLSSDDPETAFNAFRFGNFARNEGDGVKIFLIGRGVDFDKAADDRFDVSGQAESFLKADGEILACGACLKLRNSGGSEICPLSTMKDLYELVKEADRVVSF
jgi:sulfur relay (sulfurtransferase) complex TusBCD TusD component (DsrE family)